MDGIADDGEPARRDEPWDAGRESAETAEADDDTAAAVAEAFRRESGRIVAALIRLTGDWDLAEDCAQEAFAQALERWPRDGVPDRPGAWLTTTARNKALDRLRRRANEAVKLRLLVGGSAGADESGYALGVGGSAGGSVPGPGAGSDASAGAGGSGAEDGDGYGGEDESEDESGIADDRLRLIFTCCHPALSMDSRVALTLRTLAGLTTAEVARACLVSEPTMAKRLVRAKGKIRNAGIPYRVPPARLLPERTAGVMAVLYLLFNEGYAASAGSDLIRESLCVEALDLARLLAALMPAEPEPAALLALMLLHHARRAARIDPAGAPVPLEEQDRSLWDQAMIAEGVAVLDRALRHGRPGPYQVQAAIAACHATAPDAAETDWPQIALLYRSLARMTPSPVVELNRAVAVAMAQGPAAGLALVERLAAQDAGRDGALANYAPLPATRADLLRRLGRHAEAAQAYREALALTLADAGRRHLERRLAEVEAALCVPPRR